MVAQGAIGRFMRWGLTHGPIWGTLAAGFAGIPLTRVTDLGISVGEVLMIGALTGLVGGPLLGLTVAATCLAADRIPHWILDAPDYVAVLTVLAVITLAGWPTLQLAGAGTTASMAAVMVIAAAPTIDAARTAPALLTEPTQAS